MNGRGKLTLMVSVCALLGVYSQAYSQWGVNNALSKWGVKEFGTCPPKSTRFQVFLKASIKDCVKECAKRPVCKVIGYKRLYNMCELHTAAVTETDAINDKKCLRINMDTVDISQIIGDCSCEDWQVCDVTTSTCSYKECDPHTSMLSVTADSGEMLGNMNNIDSKKLLRCKPGFQLEIKEDTTVCSADGQWSDDLECIGNIAMGKPAVQSSNHNANIGLASAGVDGNTNQMFPGGSCFQTASEISPWWRVALEGLYHITSFVLYNRMDCCSTRAHDIEVWFGETVDMHLVDYIPGILPDIYHKEFGHGMLAQFVLISIRPTETVVDVLHLCEVMLNGSPVSAITNVALGKPAEQSSVYHGPASGGVDGNKVQTYQQAACFHTTQEVDPWWQVDLEALYYITSFILYNRIDQCCSARAHDIEVKFGQTLETLAHIDFIPGVLPAIYHKDVESVTLTRYAQFSIMSSDEEGDYFHLCEVELFGYLA